MSDGPNLSYSDHLCSGSLEPKKYIPRSKDSGDVSKLFDCKFCDGELDFVSLETVAKASDKSKDNLV